jgi:hypothetical protein
MNFFQFILLGKDPAFHEKFDSPFIRKFELLFHPQAFNRVGNGRLNGLVTYCQYSDQ